MTFPMGGMDVQNNDTGSVVSGNSGVPAQLLNATFSGIVAAITTYAAGTILGRVTADQKLIPCVLAAVDGSEVPMGVLDRDVITDAVPTDIELRFLAAGAVHRSRLSYNNADPVDDITMDLLRQTGIVGAESIELRKLDNQ